MPRGHLWGRDSALPSRGPPFHFARPPTPGASSWPGATLAIQGGIEGQRRPHPSSGRKARREGEEKAPLPFKEVAGGVLDLMYVSKVCVSYSAYVWNAWPVGGRNIG